LIHHHHSIEKVARERKERDTHKEAEVRDFDINSAANLSSHYQQCYHEDKDRMVDEQIRAIYRDKEQSRESKESKSVRREERKRILSQEGVFYVKKEH